jgi:hypothetical protein
LKTKTRSIKPKPRASTHSPQYAVEPITTSISGFCKISGVGRSKAYELIADGAIRTVRVGKRQFVVLDSYRQLIASQLQAE